ncbi:hypothetical protein SNOUR_08530 [Streptomyces noursei ATCC 11455]|nr:hypothetical protein SNOUR_08530 [Streptomyces noursei ATCC 11455]
MAVVVAGLGGMKSLREEMGTVWQGHPLWSRVRSSRATGGRRFARTRPSGEPSGLHRPPTAAVARNV